MEIPGTVPSPPTSLESPTLPAPDWPTASAGLPRVDLTKAMALADELDDLDRFPTLRIKRDTRFHT
jgi:hypothetical protein